MRLGARALWPNSATVAAATAADLMESIVAVAGVDKSERRVLQRPTNTPTPIWAPKSESAPILAQRRRACWSRNIGSNDAPVCLCVC